MCVPSNYVNRPITAIGWEKYEDAQSVVALMQS